MLFLLGDEGNANGEQYCNNLRDQCEVFISKHGLGQTSYPWWIIALDTIDPHITTYQVEWGSHLCQSALPRDLSHVYSIAQSAAAGFVTNSIRACNCSRE